MPSIRTGVIMTTKKSRVQSVSVRGASIAGYAYSITSEQIPRSPFLEFSLRVVEFPGPLTILVPSVIQSDACPISHKPKEQH